jgi:hypothetical protein
MGPLANVKSAARTLGKRGSTRSPTRHGAFNARKRWKKTRSRNRNAIVCPTRCDMRLTGFDAIEYAEKEGLMLNKAADAVGDELTGLSIAEAEAIATENPDLILMNVAEDDY